MAQKTTVHLVDDLDGGEADETVQFGWQKVDYEIDLADHHAKDLREVLAPYVEKARRVGRVPRSGRRAPGGGRASTSQGYNRETSRQIRDWARGKGHTVSDRGRLPGHLVAEWEREHAGG